MSNRSELQQKLEAIIGARHAYYQPPENLKMEYPAIVYKKKKIRSTYANDAMYSATDCYEMIVICRDADSPIIEKLMGLPYCAFDRRYHTDGLYHDVFTLYY